jgi:[acyl-carrier-protein] S-malonyltransferase
MSKIAFVFPGQGAQYTGMGKDFYEAFPVCREVFELASEVTGLDIAKLCFEENEKLNQTEYTQICMLTVEAAILKAVEEQGITSSVNAGLSLGEYGALVASKVMGLRDACKVVRSRGILMQNAVPTGGAMAAVLAMEAPVIEEICGKTEGIVSIANYNCPGQIVITGEESAVDAACAALKEAGAKRTVKLNVSGPFHSMMLKEAGEKLGEVLADVELRDFTVPYITNVTADYVTGPEQVKDLLCRQVASSVRWQQSVERMIADGVDTFIEMGPGKTLSGFMRKIDRSVKMMNIETVADLEKVTAALKQEGEHTC